MDNKDKIWVRGQPLKGKPYCKNWTAVIDEDAEPEDILIEYQKGAASANAKKA